MLHLILFLRSPCNTILPSSISLFPFRLTPQHHPNIAPPVSPAAWAARRGAGRPFSVPKTREDAASTSVRPLLGQRNHQRHPQREARDSPGRELILITNPNSLSSYFADTAVSQRLQSTLLFSEESESTVKSPSHSHHQHEPSPLESCRHRPSRTLSQASSPRKSPRTAQVAGQPSPPSPTLSS